MINRPNPMNCESFNVRKCPHHKKELMQEFINKALSKIPAPPDKDVSEGFSLISKVYEAFCENCKTKKSKYNHTDCLE